ncbi:MAG: histidine kinase, partial [Pseudomonadota bacterium]
MRVNSLAFRLFMTAAVWAAIVLPLAGVVIHTIYQREAQSDFDSRLKTFLYVILADSTASGAPVPDRPTNVGEALFEINESGWYWQIAPIEQTTAKAIVSGSLATGRIPVNATSSGSDPDAEGIVWTNGVAPNRKPIRIAQLVHRLGVDETGPAYAFTVAGPLDWLYAKSNGFRTLLSTALAVAGLAFLAMTFLQVRFGLKPLRQIGTGLSEIRSGDAERLEGDLPSEIQPLQSELNALIQSNEEIIDRARTQVGNLAHGLKTPLAVITNEAADAKTPFASKVAEQAEFMRTQIAHYLDRARMAAGVKTIGRVTEIEPVAQSLQRALERIYRDKGVNISIDIAQGSKFQGEKQDLEELLGNLLDNACKWCRKKVSLTAKVSS